MWNIFKWKRESEQNKLIDEIEKRIFAIVDMEIINKEEYISNKITEWTYYKNFWLFKGAKRSLRELRSLYMEQ